MEAEGDVTPTGVPWGAEFWKVFSWMGEGAFAARSGLNWLEMRGGARYKPALCRPAVDLLANSNPLSPPIRALWGSANETTHEDFCGPFY